MLIVETVMTGSAPQSIFWSLMVPIDMLYGSTAIYNSTNSAAQPTLPTKQDNPQGSFYKCNLHAVMNALQREGSAVRQKVFHQA